MKCVLSLAFMFCLPLSIALFAQTSFTEAEDLFVRNKPALAAGKLESVLREDPANIKASLYLGIALQQLGRLDEGIDVLRKALPRAASLQALFAYNIANMYFAKGGASFAEQYYTQALSLDPAFASALLNRANARIRTGALKEAVADYHAYLGLEPTSPKRPEIEKMMALIQDNFVAAERESALAAEAARDAESRRQRLLDEVSASLQAAAEDTKGLSAGSEDVIQYEGEFVLE
ncbi:hypothetical protein MASR2M78_03360 [Treponema sp.]